MRDNPLGNPKAPSDLDIRPVGDSALLVVFGDRIDLATNRRAHACAQRIARPRLAGVGECVPAYASILVHYDPLQWDFHQLAIEIASILDDEREEEPWEPRLVTIPVRYGGVHGPDLAFVASHTGLDEAEVIHLHSHVEYPVFMMGFTPGFPYLGGMDERLATPRLDQPRERVPAGSVGIAGKQTGIYSIDSPGGWRIIGRTTLRLFDPQGDAPFLLSPGDRVRFTPVEEGRDGL